MWTVMVESQRRIIIEISIKTYVLEGQVEINVMTGFGNSTINIRIKQAHIHSIECNINMQCARKYVHN